MHEFCDFQDTGEPLSRVSHLRRSNVLPHGGGQCPLFKTLYTTSF